MLVEQVDFILTDAMEEIIKYLEMKEINFVAINNNVLTT